MGAWGKRAFENDAALDWLPQLEGRGVVTLRETLSRVAETDEGDDVDVDDGSAAIAAAEVVAAALGQGSGGLPKAVSTWLARSGGTVVAQDAELARRAVGRVLVGESELRALWEQGGGGGPWRAGVQALLRRLKRTMGAATMTEPTPKRQTTRRIPTFDRDKQVLLTFLHGRGLTPDDEQLARIVASRDGAEIRRWLARAISGESVAAVLDG